MDRLHQMEVFTAVATAGSFANAARQAGLSAATVTRAVSALEARLGVQLINRTTRSLALTDAGERFLENCIKVLEEIAAAERDAMGESTLPCGHLRITASVTFGRLSLSPMIVEFLNDHPKIDLSLVLLDRVVNVIEEGFDAAIRIGALPDSSLHARRIGQVRRTLYASPKYLERHGTPTHPEELEDHSVIVFSGLTNPRDFRYVDRGRSRSVALNPRIEINDAQGAIAAAVEGEGITTSVCYMVGNHVRNGTLVPVLSEYWLEPVPVQVVFPPGRLMAAKVRAFVDWTARRLAPELKRLSPAG